MSLSGRWLVCSLGLVAVAASAAPSASPAGDGWAKLIGNQTAPARAAFAATLKQQPADLDAHRGLAILHSLADQDIGEATSLRALYRLQPDHWSARAYWTRLVEAVERTGRWDLLDGAAVDILANKKSPVELRAVALRAQAASADRMGRWPVADAARARLGYVRQWRVIGPFENESRSGHDKAFSPERSLSGSERHIGRDDLRREWRRLRLVSRQGECRVGESLGDYSPGVFYAATGIQSAAAQPAALAFEPTGASKVWLNGRLVFSDAVERPVRTLSPELVRRAVTLQPGWNTVLVKVGSKVSRLAAFSLRVTPPSGEVLKPLVADGEQARQAVEASAAASVAVPTVEPDCVEALHKGVPSTRPEAAVCEAALLRGAGDSGGAVRVLRQAVTAAPDCGWLRGQLALALAEDGLHDEARTERAAALQANAAQIEVAVDHHEDESDAAEPTERIRRLRELLKVNPSSISVYGALYAQYSGAGLGQEAMQALQKIRAARPGPRGIAALVSTYLEEDRTADAAALVTAGLKTAPYQEELLTAMSTLLEYQEKPTAALAVYERLLALNGPDPGVRESLAELCVQTGNPTRGIQLLRTLRQERPQDAAACVELADLLREKAPGKGGPEPLALYREAVRLDPSKVYLRERIQVLAKEKPVFELAPAFPTQALLAKTPTQAEAGGASAVFLLDEQRTVIYADYATASRVHMIVKILDAGAAEQYQEIDLEQSSSSSRATVETSRVIKAGGKIQDMREHAGMGSVSFPSLAPGDIIDFSYRVEDFRKGGLSRHFWDDWSFSIPGTPSKHARYVLISPPDLKLHVRKTGAAPDPEVRDVPGWRIREWKMIDIPADRPAAFGVPQRDQGTSLDISTVDSWQEIVRWYLDLSRAHCIADETVRLKAQELTREAKTEDDKLRALVRFVSGLRYQSTPFRLSAFVPTEAKEVLREQFGDCKDKAALITAMARSLGMKANMVLLSGRSSGIVPLLPSPRFNHAIARVVTASGEHWIDATADDMDLGEIPVEDQQVPALIIDEATTSLVISPVTPVASNGTIERVEGTLDASGKLTATLELTGTGNWGWTLRSALKLVPAASQPDVYRAIVARLYPGARSEGGSIENVEDRSKPVRMRVKFTVDRFATTAGNLVLLKLPWSTGQGGSPEVLTGDGNRAQDAEVGAVRGVYSSTVVLHLPAGYELQPRAGKKAETSWGSYHTTFRAEGNTLTAERRMQVSPLRIPASEVPAFAKFLREELTETQEPVVLRKP